MYDCAECGGRLWCDEVIQLFHAGMGGEIRPSGYAHSWHYKNKEYDDD